jgi:uroporphyrinogen decarboxylase
MNLKECQAFWELNQYCENRSFSTNKRHAPLSLAFDDHFLSGLFPLNIERYHTEAKYRQKIHKEANMIFRKELGRSFLPERELNVRPLRIEEIFEARMVYSGSSAWLECDIHSPDDLRRLMDRVRSLKLEDIILPEEWESEVHDYQVLTGYAVHWGTGGRGPATVGTSVMGTMNLCYWIMDEPELMLEFYSLLADIYVQYAAILREATHTYDEGWWITDDNSCLFPPEQYELFCAPVLRKLFDNFADSPWVSRFQHSDSAMGHLMPILNDLGINGVNLGPSLHPAEIRAAFPNATIHGQLPPLILRDGSTEDIEKYVIRDFEAAGKEGRMVCTTAGSVDEGTPFENIRAYMSAVERYTRYI